MFDWLDDVVELVDDAGSYVGDAVSSAGSYVGDILSEGAGYLGDSLSSLGEYLGDGADYLGDLLDNQWSDTPIDPESMTSYLEELNQSPELNLNYELPEVDYSAFTEPLVSQFVPAGSLDDFIQKLPTTDTELPQLIPENSYFTIESTPLPQLDSTSIPSYSLPQLKLNELISQPYANQSIASPTVLDRLLSMNPENMGTSSFTPTPWAPQNSTIYPTLDAYDGYGDGLDMVSRYAQWAGDDSGKNWLQKLIKRPVNSNTGQPGKSQLSNILGTAGALAKVYAALNAKKQVKEANKNAMESVNINQIPTKHMTWKTMARGGPTVSGGQDDVIPIMAAGGEYIFDADTVSALGDGDTEAGARKLDQMRMNIRKHKRSAPPTQIPPKAKRPEQYLKGAQ